LGPPKYGCTKASMTTLVPGADSRVDPAEQLAWKLIKLFKLIIIIIIKAEPTPACGAHPCVVLYSRLRDYS
jgi:hypothetical protein